MGLTAEFWLRDHRPVHHADPAEVGVRGFGQAFSGGRLFGAAPSFHLERSVAQDARPSRCCRRYLVIISKSFHDHGERQEPSRRRRSRRTRCSACRSRPACRYRLREVPVCPLDDNMKDTLYNLALDFERAPVLLPPPPSSTSPLGPKYKDVVERAASGSRPQGARGAVGGAKKDSTVTISGATADSATIEKELRRQAW